MPPMDQFFGGTLEMFYLHSGERGKVLVTIGTGVALTEDREEKKGLDNRATLLTKTVCFEQPEGVGGSGGAVMDQQDNIGLELWH